MPPYTRHLEVPVYEYRATSVDAQHYNHVHVALNHLGEGVRLELPRLKTLDLILQRDAWIVVDRAFNDLPVVAWADFETRGRNALHQPIPCRVRLFHATGGIIMKRTLEAMEMLLGELEADGTDIGNVLKFKGNASAQDD